MTPLKLHSKTTILISAVLVAVFAVIAYFYDLSTTTISNQLELSQAQIVANRVSNIVEHHVRRDRRKGHLAGQEEDAFEPDWIEVQDWINDTIIKGNQQVAEVRVFRKVAPGGWEEAVRLPEDAGPAFFKPALRRDLADSRRPPGAMDGLVVGEQDQTRLIGATADVVSPVGEGGPREIATVSVLLAFDENQSVAARLRRLIWPLIMLAVVAITLITYFLFRHIVYKPIDSLLLAMSKAEGGDLAAEVQLSAPDEIGLLTSRFNRMLARIRAMTEQLGIEQRKLEDRVREATGEIADRKEQLEEANLQLFEMQRQLTQLERLAAAGQLAAQFAHEVGTPLNLISGHVQLLRARVSDDRVVKRLDIIAGQIERITSIVRSMLDSTRKPKPELELADVNALLARIIDATQPTLAARRVELQTSLAGDLPPVEVDPDQFQQVFINLINNSLDAMPAGGTLFVSTRLFDSSIGIELSDTGEGIAGDQIDLIFDPLFTTRHDRGTGLGLTIVKQIISEHGGSVEVESEPGKGTVFRIQLPLPGANQRPATPASLPAELEQAGPGRRLAER